MANLNENIEKFYKRKLEIENLLSNSNSLQSNQLSELSKELSEIKSVTNLSEELDVKKKEILDLEDLLNDKNSENELKEMAECMFNLLNKKGTIVIEVQYLMNTLKDLTFDNIYHEHYNYWSLTSLVNFFNRFDY